MIDASPASAASGVVGAMRPSGETAVNSDSVSAAPGTSPTIRFGSSRPRSSSGANAGGGATPRLPAIQASSTRTNAGSRLTRFAWLTRPLRVSRLKPNWIGARSA